MHPRTRTRMHTRTRTRTRERVTYMHTINWFNNAPRTHLKAHFCDIGATLGRW